MSNNKQGLALGVVFTDGKVDVDATVDAAKKMATRVKEYEEEKSKSLDASANEAIDKVMKTYMNDQEGGAIRRAFENLWMEAKKTSTAPVAQG